MNIEFHFVQDRVATKTLRVQFYNNKDQMADIFTKPLVLDKFFSMQSSLHVVDAALDSWVHINSDNKGKT